MLFSCERRNIVDQNSYVLEMHHMDKVFPGVVALNDVSLQIEPGKDLCTLVTCTPYGINSHWLLVRGHRVETV